MSAPLSLWLNINSADTNWKVWIISKWLMKGLSIEKVIDENLLDSVKTYNHTYSYQDLRSMNFLIEVDESFWE